MSHEKCGAAIGTPCMLKFIDADLSDGFDAAFECKSGIVEENRGGPRESTTALCSARTYASFNRSSNSQVLHFKVQSTTHLCNC